MIRTTSFMGKMRTLNLIRKPWRRRWNGAKNTPCLTNRRRCSGRRVSGSEVYLIRKPLRVIKRGLP